MNLEHFAKVKQKIERYSDHSAHVSFDGAKWYIMERVHDLGGTDYYSVMPLTAKEAMAIVEADLIPLWFSAREAYERLYNDAARPANET